MNLHSKENTNVLRKPSLSSMSGVKKQKSTSPVKMKLQNSNNHNLNTNANTKKQLNFTMPKTKAKSVLNTRFDSTTKNYPLNQKIQKQKEKIKKNALKRDLEIENSNLPDARESVPKRDRKEMNTLCGRHEKKNCG